MSRSLCAFGEESRHCEHPQERNVFSHGDSGLPPTDGSTPNPNSASIDAPTPAPSGPTSAPSKSAAPTSSASPTSVDDREPDFPDTCVSDGGDFGETDPNAASQILVVGFQYQVQTTPNLRAENLNSEVLAQLEEALSNLLVPPLFNGHELCRFDRRRNLQQSTLAPAVGLLSAPADRILMGSEGGTYSKDRGGLEFTRV
jgi:hypothetical protein